MRKEEKASQGSCRTVGEKVKEEQDSQVFLLTAWVRMEPENLGGEADLGRRKVNLASDML